MRKLPIFIALTLFSLFFLPHLVNAVSLFPRGSHDFTFTYGGSFKTIGNNHYFCEGNACMRYSVPDNLYDSPQYKTGGTFRVQQFTTSNANINSNYLYYESDYSYYNAFFYIDVPSNAEYALVCYSWHPIVNINNGQYSNLDIMVDSTVVKHIDDTTDHTECLLLHVNGANQVIFKVNENAGGGALSIFDVQFLTSSFTTVDPVDDVQKVYYSDVNYGEEIFNRLSMPEYVDSSYGTVSSSSINIALPSTDGNIYEYYNFTNTSSGDVIKEWINHNTLYGQTSGWWNESTSLPQYWLVFSYDIYHGSYNHETYIYHLASDGVTIDYTTGIEYNGAIPGITVRLYDNGFNVIRSQEYDIDANYGNQYTVSVYKPPTDVSSDTYIMYIPAVIGTGSCAGHDCYFEVLPFPIDTQDYIVNMNKFGLGFSAGSDYVTSYESGLRYSYVESGSPSPSSITNVQLSSSDSSVVSGTSITLTGLWSGGTAPFGYNIYVKNEDYYGDTDFHKIYTGNTNSNSFTYTFTPYVGTNYIKFDVSDPNNSNVESNTVTVTVTTQPISNANLEIHVGSTNYGTSATVEENTLIDLYATWEGGDNKVDITVQSYFDGSWHSMETYSDVDNVHYYDYGFAPPLGSHQYRMIISDSNSSATTNSVTVNVVTPSVSNVQLSWSSTNVSTTEQDDFTVSWDGGQTPCNITMYVDSRYFTMLNIEDNPYSSYIVFGEPPGTFDTYVNVTCSDGSSALSNHVTVNVYEPSNPINDFHTNIENQEGRPYGTINITVHYGDVLHVHLYNITGGYPPYTAKLVNMDTNVTLWNGSVSGNDVNFTVDVSIADFPCTNPVNISSTEQVCKVTLKSVVEDSHNQTKEEFPHYINILRAIPGAELKVNLTITPIYHLTTMTETRLVVNVSGGQPPYRYRIYDDYYTVLCDDTTSEKQYQLIVYWDGGEHTRVYAEVTSADGQDAISNKYSFNVSSSIPYGCDITTSSSNCRVVNRVKDYVIGCAGNMSGWATSDNNESLWGVPSGGEEGGAGGNATVTTTLTYPSFVNTTYMNEIGLGWATPFLSLQFIISLIGLLFSAFVTKVSNGDGRVFGISVLVWVTVFSMIGIYPGWILIIIALAVGLMVFYIWQRGS